MASRSKVKAKAKAQPESPPQQELPKKEWGTKMVKGVNYRAACQGALVYGAYEKLTKEFLGTVRIAFEDVKSPKTAILYFRIGDTEYSITIRDLCKPLVSVIRTRFGSHTAKVLALNGQNLHMIPTKVIDLAFLGRKHYLGGWVDNPLQLAYRFTASYENEQISLLSSQHLPSIKSNSTPFPPSESSFYVATSNRPLSKYYTKKRKSMQIDTKLENNQARLERKLACQGLIITKLTRAVKNDTSLNLASSLKLHDLDTNDITSEPLAPATPATPNDDESASSDDEIERFDHEVGLGEILANNASELLIMCSTEEDVGLVRLKRKRRRGHKSAEVFVGFKALGKGQEGGQRRLGLGPNRRPIRFSQVLLFLTKSGGGTTECNILVTELRASKTKTTTSRGASDESRSAEEDSFVI
ncbi:hypothetical protein AtNW77_Chr5g0114461 [Arabidopsis thaliana]